MGTVHVTYYYLRVLITWMINQQFDAFCDLDRYAQRRFLAEVARRKGRNGKRVKPGTQARAWDILQLLYLQGLKYRELAIDEPSPTDAVVQRESDRRPLPYTPDEIAVPLMQGAIRLLGQPASDVTRLQSLAESAYDARVAEGKSRWLRWKAAFDVAADFTFATLPGEEGPWYAKEITSTTQIQYLVDRIAEACFVVLSYLVGMRASEILGLEEGCVERVQSTDGTEEFLFVKGRIYKTAPTDAGTPHRWIAPDIVERAIEVMEKLTQRLQRKSGRTQLWLTAAGNGIPAENAKGIIPAVYGMVSRLNNAFAPFVELPTYRGDAWHLTTHQGRKTFARFVGKRDRSNLLALQEHLGHRSIVMTDRAYAGVDHEVSELLDETTRIELAETFAETLTAERLAGAAGVRIARRSPFRGKLVEEGARDYARARLADPDFRWEICDYGYCYYRVGYSACHGDERGPNPALRTQSVCVGCKNFVAHPKHRGTWEERRKGYTDFLATCDVTPELRGDIEQKIGECDKILTQLGDVEAVTERRSDG